MDQAGKNGKTKQDEYTFVVYIKDHRESVAEVWEKILRHGDLKDKHKTLINGDKMALFFDKRLDGKTKEPLKRHERMRVSEFGIDPLHRPAPNKKTFKTKRMQRMRLETCTLDVRDYSAAAAGLEEYSPRTKTSMMSRMQGAGEHTSASLKQALEHGEKTDLDALRAEGVNVKSVEMTVLNVGKQVETVFGPGVVVGNRRADGMEVIQLSWTLAGDSKAMLYRRAVSSSTD